MSFGPRVLLLLVFGLAVALIPVDGSESDLGAVAAVAAPQGEQASPLTDETSGSQADRALIPDGLVLSQAFTASTAADLDSDTDVDVAAVDIEVLGVTATNAAGAAPELAAADTAPRPDAAVEAPTTTSTEPAPAEEAPTTTSTTTSTTTTAAPETTNPPTLPIEDQMLSLVEFDWETRFPEWEVDFFGARASIRGLTYPGEKRIELFIRSDDTPETLLRVFTHELGHVVDVELNTNEDRRRWREQRGIDDDVPWWPSAEAPDFETGAGDFAEAFAVLETGVTTRSLVGSQPTAADLALLQELMAG